MHKGLLTCHVLLREVEIVWCFLSYLNISVLCCYAGPGAGRACEVSHCSGPQHWVWSLAMSCLSLLFRNDIPRTSCESPWSLLPVWGLRAVSLRQLHLCSPCPPEVQGLVGGLRVTCAERDLRLTCLPFQDLYFWLCWNLQGAGKTASSTEVDG